MQKKETAKSNKIEFSKDFLDFFVLLNENKVEYMLIGGYAVSFYGYPRFTGDIDIWINNTKRNAEKVLKSMSEFGIPVKKIKIEDLTSNEPMNGLYFGKEPFRIDIITALEELSFKESYKSLKKIKVNKVTIKVISKTDLIKNKIKSGRHKDLADVEELKRK
ncbi:MAG: nucleotidyltransferase [Ignavibacteria bacterium]